MKAGVGGYTTFKRSPKGEESDIYQKWGGYRTPETKRKNKAKKKRVRRKKRKPT